MNDKNLLKYKNSLQISVIAVLLFLTLFFYFFQRFEETVQSNITYEPAIEILFIPPTSQQILRRPPPPKPIIPVAEVEPEILRPVSVESETAAEAGIAGTETEFLSGLPEGFRPKQLLEVVPQKVNEQFKGEVILALKIGKNGMVAELRVLQNTTGTEECERRAVEAAKASIWEPAVIDGRPVIHWIEKTYQFNLSKN